MQCKQLRLKCSTGAVLLSMRYTLQTLENERKKQSRKRNVAPEVGTQERDKRLILHIHFLIHHLHLLLSLFLHLLFLLLLLLFLLLLLLLLLLLINCLLQSYSQLETLALPCIDAH